MYYATVYNVLFMRLRFLDKNILEMIYRLILNN